MEKILISKENKSSLSKHLIIGIIGFGLVGILWGTGLFYEAFIKKSQFDLIETPYVFYLPAILFLALGGSLFSILFKDRKKMFKKLVLFGLVGSVIGFLGELFLVHFFSVFWVDRIIGTLFWILGSSQMAWESISILEPSLMIGGFFLSFAFIGFIISAFYALALKIKILSLAKYGAIGFALGSLIGPVVGNGILNLSGSLFLTYLITFFIICAFLGMFLGLGIYKSSVLKTLDKNSDAENSNSENF